MFFAFIFQTKFNFESFLQLPTTAVSTHQTLKLSITKLPELYKVPQNFLLGENYLFNFSLTKIKCDQIGILFKDIGFKISKKLAKTFGGFWAI